MLDTIVCHNDTVMIKPAFGAAIVVPSTGIMISSSPSTVKGMKPCLVGDEKKVSIICTYHTLSHPVPGTGLIKIELMPNQKATQTKINGKPVLLKGSIFNAKLEVKAPAKMLGAGGIPVPDATPVYMGQGYFLSNPNNPKAS